MAFLQLQYLFLNLDQTLQASSLNLVLNTQYTKMFIDEFTTNNKWLTHITTKDHNGNGCFSALKERIENIQKVFLYKRKNKKILKLDDFLTCSFLKKGKFLSVKAQISCFERVPHIWLNLFIYAFPNSVE